MNESKHDALYAEVCESIPISYFDEPDALDFWLKPLPIQDSLISTATLPNLSESELTDLEHQFLNIPPSPKPLTLPPLAPSFSQYLHEFMGAPRETSPKRKRRKFSPGRREEVTMMRKTGACTRCRLLKKPVSRYLPPDRVSLLLTLFSVVLNHRVPYVSKQLTLTLSGKISVFVRNFWMSGFH